MAIVTTEYLINQMRFYNCPYYFIKDNGGKREVSSNQIIDNIDESIERLNYDLSNITGELTIDISNKTRFDKSKGSNVKTYTYNIINKQSAINSNNSNDSSLLSIYRDFNERLRQSEMDRMRQEFEYKIAALNTDNKSMFDHPLAAQLITSIISGFNTGAIRTNGTPSINGTEIDQTADLAKLKKCISRLIKSDPNFIINMELLANLSEKNPAMYSQAVKMLHSFN